MKKKTQNRNTRKLYATSGQKGKSDTKDLRDNKQVCRIVTKYKLKILLLTTKLELQKAWVSKKIDAGKFGTLCVQLFTNKNSNQKKKKKNLTTDKSILQAKQRRQPSQMTAQMQILQLASELSKQRQLQLLHNHAYEQ